MATGMAYSVALDGVVGRVVSIEADISDGLSSWSLTGLADVSVSEARDRCRSAIVNSDQAWPDRRITVAMYPADVPKVGTHYDLAIALAILAAKEVVPAEPLIGTCVFGELVLDGRLRAVPGVLPAVLAAVDAGLERVIVPMANVGEASLVQGINVVGVASLAECLALLTGQPSPATPAYAPLPEAPHQAEAGSFAAAPDVDLSDVRGQAGARWCVEVAAAGGHHLFLEGPAGAGKTMLAVRMVGLLPDLDFAQAIEVSQIHSVAGLLRRDEPLRVRPPYVAPHHSDSVAAVIGGGSKHIRPGAISLAHRGLLFLDEALEFRPSVHDALRQPLETGQVSIRRSETAAAFPARFQLVMAANPCACGKAQSGPGRCECRPNDKRRYQDRISGPVRDRIDMHHEVRAVSPAELRQPVGAEASTAATRARVEEARARQRRRFTGTPWRTNCDVPGFELRRRCPLGADVGLALEDLLMRGKLTQRGADRVVRLSWTLADLAGLDRPGRTEVRRAIGLRDGRFGDDLHSRRGQSA